MKQRYPLLLHYNIQRSAVIRASLSGIWKLQVKWKEKKRASAQVCDSAIKREHFSNTTKAAEKKVLNKIAQCLSSEAHGWGLCTFFKLFPFTLDLHCSQDKFTVGGKCAVRSMCSFWPWLVVTSGKTGQIIGVVEIFMKRPQLFPVKALMIVLFPFVINKISEASKTNGNQRQLDLFEV